MAWYEDLSVYDDRHRLKAVGWLSRSQPYAVGEASEVFFDRLCQLLQHPWDPGPAAAGTHHCELCRFTGGPVNSRFRDYIIRGYSSSFLYVPGQGCLYISPVSISHYIDAHGYLPPEEFRQAVMNCPPMSSVGYHKAVLENGGRGLGKPPV